jgi:hypothetical protein
MAYSLVVYGLPSLVEGEKLHVSPPELMRKHLFAGVRSLGEHVIALHGTHSFFRGDGDVGVTIPAWYVG